MGLIAERLPVIACQVGLWRGEYVHVDPDCNIIDRHKSTLVVRLEDSDAEGEAKLCQTNIYDWADGSREIRYFECVYRGDRLWIDNTNINGWAGALALDETESTVMVGWVRAGEPDFRYYEMVNLAEDRKSKDRVWHWYKNSALFQRTLIHEDHVDQDWRPYDDPSYYAYRPRAMVAA